MTTMTPRPSPGADRAARRPPSRTAPGLQALRLLLAVASATAMAAPAAERARALLQPGTPSGDFALEQAMACGSTDVAAPQFYFWTGQVYGRRAGEPDRLLFEVQGVNPRACRRVEDPARGSGYQAAARELMLYLDPETRQVLDTWRNPWTGELVRVIHMENDPASMRAPAFPLDAQGRPTPARLGFVDMGRSWVATRSSSFFRDSPLGGGYQDYVGGKYRVMELSTFTLPRAEVEAWRPGRPLPYTATWVRISDWLPWMKMAGREGQMVLTSQGRSTLAFDELPEPLRSTIASRYPAMRRTPEFDDPRPFQTSWDSLRKALDEARGP
ncbi:MAG: DUF1838 domain-containing protein [Steroidobacteraceae bacterium]|jgi:hypothetical protein|nr:DUF1838 domain-containing protein [Steroidobacteraceae bacterium]